MIWNEGPRQSYESKLNKILKFIRFPKIHRYRLAPCILWLEMNELDKTDSLAFQTPDETYIMHSIIAFLLFSYSVYDTMRI